MGKEKGRGGSASLFCAPGSCCPASVWGERAAGCGRGQGVSLAGPGQSPAHKLPEEVLGARLLLCLKYGVF